MPPLENTTYNCQVHGHIFGAWMPQDRQHVRRVCVIPWCSLIDLKEAKA